MHWPISLTEDYYLLFIIISEIHSDTHHSKNLIHTQHNLKIKKNKKNYNQTKRAKNIEERLTELHIGANKLYTGKLMFSEQYTE